MYVPTRHVKCGWRKFLDGCEPRAAHLIASPHHRVRGVHVLLASTDHVRDVRATDAHTGCASRSRREYCPRIASVFRVFLTSCMSRITRGRSRWIVAYSSLTLWPQRAIARSRRAAAARGVRTRPPGGVEAIEKNFAAVRILFAAITGDRPLEALRADGAGRGRTASIDVPRAVIPCASSRRVRVSCVEQIHRAMLSKVFTRGSAIRA